MMARRRICLLLHCALMSAAFPLFGQSTQTEMPDGIAMITSHQGAVTLTAADGRARKASLHAVEVLSGLEVRSGSDNTIFFSLSNGVGLGLHGDTQLRIESYQQQPVPPGRESIDFEPTRSRLVMQLLQGSLVFSAEHISPLSELVIQLPDGQVAIHRATGKVRLDDNGAHISIVSGIVAYNYPDGEEQTFINAPNRVWVSPESAREGRIADSQPIGTDPSDALTRHLVKAAGHARERVIFKASADDPTAPQPILVARPEVLQKPSPRPYRYRD